MPADRHPVAASKSSPTSDIAQQPSDEARSASNVIQFRPYHDDWKSGRTLTPIPRRADDDRAYMTFEPSAEDTAAADLWIPATVLGAAVFFGGFAFWLGGVL